MGTIIGFVVFLIVLLILGSAGFKGAFGEYRVRHALRSRLDDSDYRIFNDLTLPTRDGTTQVDHVIVSRFGIFVLETKNMKGWIFGNAEQRRWTQVIYRWKSQFQNPIHQNYKHVKAVQELLRIDGRKVRGIVAFVGSAEPRSAFPASVVWGTGALVDEIRSQRTALLNDDEVEAIAARLADDAHRSTAQTRNAHVRHVKSQAATRRSTENCPRCGAALVERTNRQSGERFLACTRYPACKGTRPL